ncbi:MAG: retroviral-like aspartic protease family protein [Caulobacteraceae bacterium]
MAETDLNRRFVATLLAAMAAGSGKAAAQKRHSAEDDALVAWLDEGATASTIETADDPYKRMTAPVMINRQGPFHFVVDTGANQSVMSVELAAALSLPPGPPIRLNGVAGMEVTQTVSASLLEIGEGAADPNASFAVLPEAAIGAQGILGVDRFRNRRITLDFRARRLVIESGYNRFIPFSVKVPAVKRSGQLMIVDASLAGIRLSAFLDSGAERTIGNPALLQLATLRRPSTRFYDAPIVSVTGATLPGQIALLPVLKLGGVTLTNLAVTFADLHIFRIWNLTQPSLLIGVDLLSVFDAVTLDFKRSEVLFQMRPDQLGPPKISIRPESDTRIPRK